MMSGPVHVHCSIMPMIVRSASEAETGGAYYEGKDACHANGMRQQHSGWHQHRLDPPATVQSHGHGILLD
jgi:hypothetical protein